MKKSIFVSSLILGAAFGVGVISFLTRYENTGPVAAQETPMLTITSPAFENNERIPSKYSCDGQNVNPVLNFSRMPSETKSLVLIIDDPDAPGGNFNHLAAWNIDPKTTGIQEGVFPPGTVLGKNGAGKNGYLGPCPPSGTHRYYFKVYALDIVLDLDPASDKTALEVAMEGHIIGRGELMGKYLR